MPNKKEERSSISELVSELIDILKKEASLFGAFLELLEMQQEALVGNDVAKLSEVTEAQRRKIVESGVLARKRESLLRKISVEGHVMEDLTLSRLINIVSSGSANILEHWRDAIVDLNAKISRVRSQNELLIKRSRENIMKTMELLGRFKIPSSNYQDHGGLDSPGTNLALDRRA